DVLNAVLTDAGLSAIAEGEVRTMIGGGARRLVERALTKLSGRLGAALGDRLTAEVARRYAAPRAKRSAPYPGGRTRPRALPGTGVRLGVCTNKPAEATASLLAALDVLPFFQAVVGEGEDRPRKPHPAMLLAVLGTLGVAPSDAVMVGDSWIDVATARAAGVPIVLVSYGYSTERPQKLGADAVIDDMASLPAIMSRLAPSRLGRPRGPTS